MPRAPRLLHADLDALAAGARVALSPEAAHHAARVVRMTAGDALTLFDGAGHEADAVVVRVDGRRVDVELVHAAHAGIAADGAGVVWLQGMPKGDKLDAIVQKATELGVARIVPVFTARSVPRPARDPAARTVRLREIATAAAAQSGRADVPQVHDAATLEDALTALPATATLRIVPWEDGGEPLARWLDRTREQTGPCAVLVGPEGGLEAGEVARARLHGFVAVTLGPRVWRTETVAPALLSVLSYARGDLALR